MDCAKRFLEPVPAEWVPGPRSPGGVASRWSGRLARATVLLWLAAAAPALVDCVFEGRSYPEGTRIGDFVCENGEWVLGLHSTPPPLDGAERG